MKTKRRHRLRRRRAYTLVELALAMGLGLVIATITLALFNQQMTFLRIFKAQDFLTREAPLINNYVVRVVGRAEGFQLYGNMDNLRDGDPPVLVGANVMVLRFRGPDGVAKASVVSFEAVDGDTGLYYRVIAPDGSIPAEPDWAISRQPTGVNFTLNTGILQMTITGPNNEQLVYSGTEQL